MPRNPLIALALTLALGIGLAAPREASADASGLCRAFTTMALAPTDIIFGPIIASKDMYYGLTEIGDSTTIRAIGFVPGWLWLNTLQGGGAVIRFASGAYEILPGFATLFRDGPSTPLNRSQDEAWALYSEDFGPCPIRIGSSYQTINEN